MAPSTIRKALGAVKDQTSIGLAKVSSNLAPELDVAIVKATGHDEEPADEKYLREILNLTSYSHGYVGACVTSVSKRIGKTHDWIVALKSIMLIHRLLAEGDPAFHHEILYATRRGSRLLNLSDFRDEAHSNSWDHSAFVRTYALYLDQRLECMAYERKQGSGGLSSSSSSLDGYDRRRPPDYGGGSYTSRYSPSRGNGNGNGEEEQEKKAATPLRDMKAERVLGRMHQLQQLLDRFLACRPTGTAKNCRMILIALYPVVRESFQLYADICEILAALLDRFFDMDYADCVKSFEAYASAAKQIDELSAFYAWCKDTGVARSSEYPEVQRITDKLLETLEEFMRDRAKRPKSPQSQSQREVYQEEVEEEEAVQDMNSIKALPAPSDYEEPPPKEKVEPQQQHKEQEDLLNLKDETISAEDHANRFALALFSDGGPAPGNKSNGSWEAFAAEPGKADWELALVESASNLSNHKATLAGGFDPLLLNGMYDQGAVRQQMSAQISGGSASSVALPGRSSTTPVLALPAPDGTMQTIGPQDPFAASLTVPPPSYVQMADMEKKQQFLIQEQHVWQHYAQDGMQGQASVAKLNPAMPPYGIPPPLNNNGYYYPSY